MPDPGPFDSSTALRAGSLPGTGALAGAKRRLLVTSLTAAKGLTAAPKQAALLRGMLDDLRIENQARMELSETVEQQQRLGS